MEQTSDAAGHLLGDGTLITKRELAAILQVSSRTLTAWTNRRLIPEPVRKGKNAAWHLGDLKTSFEDCLSGWTTARRQRFQAYVDQVAARQLRSEAQAELSIALERAERPYLPAGIYADDEGLEPCDVRQELFARNKVLRDVRRDAMTEVRELCGTAEAQIISRFIEDHTNQIDTAEGRLANEFLPSHQTELLLGARPLLTSSLFNIRNRSSERAKAVQLSWSLSSGDVMEYGGPELRQEDGLVFMAIISIAKDVRVGRMVSFSPGDVCRALFNSYSGPIRSRLRDAISRLQDGKVIFPGRYSVQLLGRFEFPNQGRWSVAVDTSVLNLFSQPHLVVRLEYAAVVSLGAGLASWLYRYIRSQTTLIPTKVAALRELSGAASAIDDFRASLRDALATLTAGAHLAPSWRIDTHDRVRWMKPNSDPEPTAYVAAE